MFLNKLGNARLRAGLRTKNVMKISFIIFKSPYNKASLRLRSTGRRPFLCPVLHYQPVDYYLWGTVKDKCYAYKPETIDALMDNIREALGEIQLHTIDVLKN